VPDVDVSVPVATVAPSTETEAPPLVLQESLDPQDAGRIDP